MIKKLLMAFGIISLVTFNVNAATETPVFSTPAEKFAIIADFQSRVPPWEIININSDNIVATDVLAPDPVKTDKTTEAFYVELADSQEFNITDANDILGSGAYAEASALSAGPQQTGIGTSCVKITQFDTVGKLKNCTVANNAITVGISGTYRAAYSVSFNGSANDTFTIAIHVNYTEIAKSKTGRKIGTGGDIGNTSGFAIGQLSVGDVVGLRVFSNNGGGADMTVQAGNFELERIR